MHYDEYNRIVIQKEDECYTCSRFFSGRGKCWLISSILAGALWLPDGGNTIQDCPQYNRMKNNIKHLKIVGGTDVKTNAGANPGERT